MNEKGAEENETPAKKLTQQLETKRGRGRERKSKRARELSGDHMRMKLNMVGSHVDEHANTQSRYIRTNARTRTYTYTHA